MAMFELRNVMMQYHLSKFSADIDARHCPAM